MDACVSRLIVLMKTSPRTFTPNLFVSIAISLSQIRLHGDLDMFFTSKRYAVLVMLVSQNIFAGLPEFLEDDIGLLASVSIEFIGEEGLRRLFYRGAQLKVGL